MWITYEIGSPISSIRKSAVFWRRFRLEMNDNCEFLSGIGVGDFESSRGGFTPSFSRTQLRSHCWLSKQKSTLLVSSWFFRSWLFSFNQESRLRLPAVSSTTYEITHYKNRSFIFGSRLPLVGFWALFLETWTVWSFLKAAVEKDADCFSGTGLSDL